MVAVGRATRLTKARKCINFSSTEGERQRRTHKHTHDASSKHKKEHHAPVRARRERRGGGVGTVTSPGAPMFQDPVRYRWMTDNFVSSSGPDISKKIKQTKRRKRNEFEVKQQQKNRANKRSSPTGERCDSDEKVMMCTTPAWACMRRGHRKGVSS